MSLSYERRAGTSPDNSEKIGRRPQVGVFGIGRVGGIFLQPHIGAEVTAITRSNRANTEGAAHNVSGLDIKDSPEKLYAKLENLKVNGVRTIINTAGVVVIDQELENQRWSANPEGSEAYRANVVGARNLAQACREADLKLIHVSTESVFGKDRDEPYKETDVPDMNPPHFDRATGRALSYYGETKFLGEQAVLEEYPEGAVVVRMAGVQGPKGGLFALTVNDLLGEDEERFQRVTDALNTHLTADTTRDTLLAIEKGLHDPDKALKPIYHVTGTPITPFEIASGLTAGLHKRGIKTASFSGITQVELEENTGMIPRVKKVILDTSSFSEDFYPLPTTEEEIDKYVAMYLDTFL